MIRALRGNRRDSHWLRLLVGATALLLASAACKKTAGTAKVEGKAPDPGAMAKLQEEEIEFLSQLGALERERKELEAEMETLAATAATSSAAPSSANAGGATGGTGNAATTGSAETAKPDTSTERARIITARLSEIKGKQDVITQQYYQRRTELSGCEEDMADREAAVAIREREFARREQAVARREADLALRERDFTKREKEMCGPQITTIVQAPSGSRYGKGDVEPTLIKARNAMSAKGILASDLPAPASGLEKEATSAMQKGDYGKAKFAADQLLATVESVKIDGDFITAKIRRLNKIVQRTKLGDQQREDTLALFREATSDYGDGRFAAANGKLNRIYALVR
ncbi:MAG: hypothetical protein V2A73_07125 [Pseudomonadota bacterium]